MMIAIFNQTINLYTMMQKYQQLEKVGSGNFSTVHLVRNTETGETAAMKVMRTHHKIAIKEAYFLKNFEHPNIVKLLDFQQDPGKGQTKLVLEYLPENILQLYEQQQYGLRQQQVKCILFQAALGLAYVHERGIIHRDIKPQNILIDKRKAQIKLIDFGLAISEQKVSTDYVATRWYRAPENLLNTKEYSCLIDVFSLACVIVELYLGSPLFPGADNIDQLYRIFNILGEPTEEKWPLGYRKFKDMGFKMDPSKALKKGQEGFGLRSLLKNCSEGLSSLLEKMLTLCPKNRIKSKEILHDAYFGDVKTIIPPSIYKRYEKDHILKKTLQRNQNKNEGFSSPTNIRPKLQRNNEQRYEISMISSPSKIQINNTNCGLINLALSPMKTLLTEGNYLREKQNQLNSLSARPQVNIRQYQQNHQPQNQNTLTFRGFNPIKNNKVSIKQTKKQVQNHSNYKSPQKDSRNNSIDSSKSKGKMISNSIDLGKKLLNYSGKMGQIVKVQRRLTNERDYRTPDIKNKSLDKGKVIYYFQGDKNRVSPSPQKIVMPAMNIPIQSSLRFETKAQPQQNFIPIDSSIRVTRNNSAINLPARVAPPEMRTFVKPRSKQRISHSPAINITQTPYNRFTRIQTKRQQPRQTIYTSPAYDKLKFFTNQTSPQHQHQQVHHHLQRVDLSQQTSTLNLSSMNTPQTSVLRQEKMEKGFQFKQRANPSTKPNNQQQNEAFRSYLLDQKYNKMEKPKHFKSVQPREMTEAAKYFTSLQGKKDNFSLAQLKNVQIDDRRDYRQPRISAKKIDNRISNGQTFSQMLSSPRQNNININLNVSFIQGQNKHDTNFSKQKRNRF